MTQVSIFYTWEFSFPLIFQGMLCESSGPLDPLSFRIPADIECMIQVVLPYFQRQLSTCHFVVPQMLMAWPIVHSSKHPLLKAVYEFFYCKVEGSQIESDY